MALVPGSTVLFNHTTTFSSLQTAESFTNGVDSTLSVVSTPPTNIFTQQEHCSETFGHQKEKGRKDSHRNSAEWSSIDEGSTTPPIHISMPDEDVNEKEEATSQTEKGKTPEIEKHNAIDEESPDTPKAITSTANVLTERTVSPPTIDGASDTRTSVPIKRMSLAPSIDGDKALPSRPRPLSQRLTSSQLDGQQRNTSPRRFPVRVNSSESSRSTSPAPVAGHESPLKRMSIDAAGTMPRPSEIDMPPSQPLSPSSEPISPPLSGGMFRKASSGFGGLLSRMSRNTALSPPAAKRGSGMDRRNSAHSASGYDSAAIASLAAIADGPEDGQVRPSLQDRFRTLREQGEHHDDDEDEDIDHEDPLDETAGDVDVAAEKAATRTKRASSTQSQLKHQPPNSDLPPGTASGMSAGPAKQPTPVNWDLWQTVVYEGPAAVARTSGEELSTAISSGIPAAIRGVVWQVLAESKSDELEALYKTLKTRGSEPEAKLPALPRADSEVSQVAEKEDAASSRSSLHSESSSNPAASSVTTPPASIEGNNSELQHKLLAEKQKRESAALQKLERAIKRDLGTRTSYSKYTQSAGLQDGLFGVCKAYALFDTTVGYAQGINFIAMPLLFNMPEEEAFTTLIRMMHHYQLRTLFEPEMPGLHLRLHQFERLLEDMEPALFCHLKRRQVSPQLYATQWFLTLFAYRFPLQLVLRVYDLFFSEGLTAIMKFGLVLMQKNRNALLEMKDMSQLTTFLKEKLFDVYIDKSPSASSILDSGFFGSVTGGADKELYRADELVQDATQIQISKELLRSYEVEWEESRRIEREREAELETLRTANTQLTTRVKTLEERVQQHDSEHVGLASDLVKYKVENDQLHDTREALEIQVSELQKMVDAQPAEVEAKLKAEMDRIMHRNLEVQNENRHLQDELENAEQQLVKISMTHAETQADFDTLKQKWSGLQAMMNGR